MENLWKTSGFRNSQIVSTDTLATADTPQYLRASSREAVFDILKGIGIVEVLLHHCLSHSARKYTEQGSGEWWGLMVANRILHFAVPLFLLVSALLFARSLAQKNAPNWGRFYDRRVRRTVQPYLVWTLAYLAFRLWIMRLEGDLLPATLVLPFGLEVTGPTLLFDVGRLGQDLIWGNGFFHLYFMAILLQMAIVFPIVFGLLRRFKPSFGSTVAVALGLQLGCLLLQRSFAIFASPASTVVWYLPPVVLGAWIGLNWSEWPAIWGRFKAATGVATIAGFAGYLTCSILLLKGLGVNGLLYNASFTLFATGLGLFLLQASQKIAATPFAKPLAALGNVSIAVFLIHPMVMYLLSGPKVSGVFASLPLTALWVTVAVSLISYGLVVACIRLRLDSFLFGRSLAPAPQPVAQPVPIVTVDGSAPALRAARVDVYDPVLDPQQELGVASPAGAAGSPPL